MKKLLGLLLQMESNVEKYNELETKETNKDSEMEKKVLMVKMMINHMEINELMKDLLDKEMENILKDGEA